jgi:hypothetical protein
MLQALGEVVERPAVLFLLFEKMTSLESWDMYFLVFNVCGQYLAMQLRTVAIKINPGQWGCGVRTCGLFH